MTEITRNLSKDVTRLQNIGMSLEKEEHNVKAVDSLGNTAAQLSKEVTAHKDILYLLVAS